MADGHEFSLQYRVVPHEGKIRWVSMRGQVECGSSGQAVSIIGVAFDITARKTAKLEAERHRTKLVRMARVGLLGQLSGSIAHELNQRLADKLSSWTTGAATP